MGKIFCFGELLLRMSPALRRKWIHSASMPVYIGGAELNVANALARWGLAVKYCTILPDHFLSHEICDELEKNNIDTCNIHFSGNRIGQYFLSQGGDLKNQGVVYDRMNSSFASLKPGMIDWEEILDNVSWFHFSAISPALNEDVALVCKEAVTAAARKGIIISIDLNYRSKLWNYDRQPVEIMPALVEQCDVIMGNIWSANSLLQIGVDNHIHDKISKDAYLEHASKTAQAIMQQFPKCKTVANTFRFDVASGIKYYASLDQSSRQYVSSEFHADSIIDKVGSGDCFMAGLIYGLFNRLHLQEVIDFAAAAAFGKLQESGDATNQDIDSIKSILKTACIKPIP